MSPFNFESVILIVDDDPDILELMSIRVQDLLPVEVITETSPFRALKILKERDIPVVITDINMPGMNGVELLQKIQALLKGVQVIVITAGTATINCIECFRHGASDFLIKPIDDEEFKKVLQVGMDRFGRWDSFMRSRKVGKGLLP